MNGYIIVIKARRRWLIRAVLWLMILLFGVISSGSCIFTQDPTTLSNFKDAIELHDEDTADPLFGLSVAFSAEHYSKGTPRNMGVWDSGAFPIVLDSGTSKSTTPFFSDLLHPRPYESDLQGVGKGKTTHVGSIRYEIQDDNGRTATLIDDECYYCATAPYRLFCLHSWKQQINNHAYALGDSEGTGAAFMTDPSSDDAYILTWDRQKFQ